MEKKLLTQAEKTERAKKLRDFFLEINEDEKLTDIYWENVYQRALWILED